MLKKIILLLIMICLVSFGFAQKNKRKSTLKSPKIDYIEVLINGSTMIAEQYCPDDSITFEYQKLDPNIEIDSICWWFDVLYYTQFCDVNPIKMAYEYKKDDIYDRLHNIELRYKINTDSVPYRDTIRFTINVDFVRIENEDYSVCQGRDITVTTNFGDTTFYNVQEDQYTSWETLPGLDGDCDTLMRWHIIMDPYITEEYSISSCDSVIWENLIFRKAVNQVGDTTITESIVFFASDPDSSCDTLKILTVTIIDTGVLIINFEQDAFCAGDDPEGTIELETNYTAFDWKYYAIEKYTGTPDTTFTVFEPSIEIEFAGYYYVFAYMDTSLYDTLKNLRIVNDCPKWDTILVKDCELIIPNVITPNGDGLNEVLGIKKLNLKRDNDLTIYDRWGKNVFHKRNYNCVYRKKNYENIEEAFNGTNRDGRDLPEGTYYYAFKYGAIPKQKKYTGTILILR